MKNDIVNREDIYLIVNEFYKELFADENLKHFFEKFNQTNELEKHLQILVDFWDNILFFSGTYQRNAMLPHIKLNNEKPFKKLHFDLWLKHFHKTIDEHFIGDNAQTAKNRATSIATVMKLKTLNY